MTVGRQCVIIKRDIKTVFRNIPVPLNVRWLLGFCWRTCFYTENSLSFGLSISPFIFDLFAENFYWVLQSFIGWDLEHYLDNNMTFLPAIEATPKRIRMENNNYSRSTDNLRIFQHEKRDLEETIVLLFGIKLETVLWCRTSYTKSSIKHMSCQWRR